MNGVGGENMEAYFAVVGYFVPCLLVQTSFTTRWSDYRGWWMPGPGMMGWGWILMIIFWALVIIGVIFLIMWLAGRSQTNRGRGPDSALEILRERYAKGEINKEEFEQKKRDLM